MMTIMRKDRGELLYLPRIMEITGMAEGTVRSRYHLGQMPFLWKLGRRLVAWERDLEAWLDEQQQATTKTPDGSAPTEERTPTLTQVMEEAARWEQADSEGGQDG